MQNKKPLLKRLLVIYITLFIVIIVSIVHSVIPDFTIGSDEGSALGHDIAKSWLSGSPREVFMLDNVPLVNKTDFQLDGVIENENLSIKADIKHINLVVERSAPDSSVMCLAFSVLGGSPWVYLLVMMGGLSYLAVIVLMFAIIISIRKSIKEETTLANRNVWCVRIIGLLTIFSELSKDFYIWIINSKAAEVLANTQIAVDTTFTVSYSNIILGILIIFTAEVFAIGQNLSEEQKFTI